MKDFFTYNKIIDKLLIPNVRTENMGKHSMQYFGPLVWNTMLPDKLKSSLNINIFKESVKAWVPENCNCNLCKDWVDGVGYWNIRE